MERTEFVVDSAPRYSRQGRPFRVLQLEHGGQLYVPAIPRWRAHEARLRARARAMRQAAELD